MIRLLPAVVAVLPLMVAAQSGTAPEVVCDLATMTTGRMDGRVFREDRLDPDDGVRLTFRGHDREGGRASMLIGDEQEEHAVAMTVDRDAIVYLYEEAGRSKMLVATAGKPSPDGWSATATWHAWTDGAMRLRVMAGACRLRAR